MSDAINFLDAPPPLTESPVVAVFDPPLCCPSGMCGPTIDQTLVDLNEALQELRGEGLHVERYEMTTSPQAFLGNADVVRLMREQQMAALPLTVVRGQVVKVGAYPSLTELRAALNGHNSPPATAVSRSP